VEREFSAIRAFDLCGWACEETPVTPYNCDILGLEIVWVEGWIENTAWSEVLVFVFFGFQSAALIVAGEWWWLMTNSTSWSAYHWILRLLRSGVKSV
jgi:hypothetical protein